MQTVTAPPTSKKSIVRMVTASLYHFKKVDDIRGEGQRRGTEPTTSKKLIGERKLSLQLQKN